jgi:hypothetical protein
MALGFGFASLLSFSVALVTWNARMGLFNPGILLGVFFGAMAVVVLGLSFRIKPDSWWRDMVALDDESLNSMSMRRRRDRR